MSRFAEVPASADKADEEKEEGELAGLGSHGVRRAQSCHIESAPNRAIKRYTVH